MKVRVSRSRHLHYIVLLLPPCLNLLSGGGLVELGVRLDVFFGVIRSGLC